jgi:hypothetical protein
MNCKFSDTSLLRTQVLWHQQTYYILSQLDSIFSFLLFILWLKRWNYKFAGTSPSPQGCWRIRAFCPLSRGLLIFPYETHVAFFACHIMFVLCNVVFLQAAWLKTWPFGIFHTLFSFHRYLGWWEKTLLRQQTWICIVCELCIIPRSLL